MKIAFDVGGVLSKYPAVFGKLIGALWSSDSGVECFVISDMHPVEKIIAMLEMNRIPVYPNRVHSADYKKHGENCKAILCDELGINILIDDFIGYVATGNHIRLLVMPNPNEPYYADSWKTDGSEGDFGRRNPPESKRPQA